jgi:DNA-binding NarL/FixJ family response regulator
MSDIRIIIADDHAVVRKGTRQILEEEKDLVIVGEAINGQEAVILATKLKPDIAIVDISMPVLDGIEATKQIKQMSPDTAVLILSAYDNDEFVFALWRQAPPDIFLKT